MFTRSKKSIVLILLLAIGTNSYLYSMNFFSLWNKANQQSTFQKTKNYIKAKAVRVKNKIVKHATIDNVSLAITVGCYISLFAFFCSPWAKKIMSKNLKDIPSSAKKQIIETANKLNIKNAETISLKILENLEGCRYNGCNDVAGNILFSKAVIQNVAKNKSKFIIGHELGHFKYKHGFRYNLVHLVTSILALYVYRNMLPKTNDNLFDSNISIMGRLIILSLSTFKNMLLLLGPARTAASLLLNNSLGKCMEAQADITAASLGKKVAEAGINDFKNKKMEPSPSIFLSMVAKIYDLAHNPHPPNFIRIKYLNWYKNWKYGSNSR